MAVHKVCGTRPAAMLTVVFPQHLSKSHRWISRNVWHAFSSQHESEGSPQDLKPRGGGIRSPKQVVSGALTYYLDKIMSSKTAWKLKKFGPRGRGSRPCPLHPHPPFEMLSIFVTVLHSSNLAKWYSGKAIKIMTVLSNLTGTSLSLHNCFLIFSLSRSNLQ